MFLCVWNAESWEQYKVSTREVRNFSDRALHRMRPSWGRCCSAKSGSLEGALLTEEKRKEDKNELPGQALWCDGAAACGLGTTTLKLIGRGTKLLRHGLPTDFSSWKFQLNGPDDSDGLLITAQKEMNPIDPCCYR